MFENVFKYYFETVRTAQSVLPSVHETTYDGLLLYNMPLQLHLMYKEWGKKWESATDPGENEIIVDSIHIVALIFLVVLDILDYY